MRPDRLQLRIAIHDGDGMALRDVLGGRVWGEVLQLAGDAVVQAVKHTVPGSAELAGGWIDALHERDWGGDDDLAVELEAALGRRPTPALKNLAVDLEELSMLLEAGFGEDGGVIDLRTGEVWRASTIEYFREEMSMEGRGPFGASRTWSRDGPMSWSAGIASRTSDAVAALASG